MGVEKIGEVAKYFAKVAVAGIQVEAGSLSVGDTIHIRGHTTDFTQKVESMQLENQAIEKATPELKPRYLQALVTGNAMLSGKDVIS